MSELGSSVWREAGKVHKRDLQRVFERSSKGTWTVPEERGKNAPFFVFGWTIGWTNGWTKLRKSPPRIYPYMYPNERESYPIMYFFCKLKGGIMYQNMRESPPICTFFCTKKWVICCKISVLRIFALLHSWFLMKLEDPLYKRKGAEIGTLHTLFIRTFLS